MTFYILVLFWLRIAINLILIIFYNDFLFIHSYDKTRRQQRDLAAPCGEVNDKFRDGHPGYPSLKPFDDIEAALDRGPQMFSPPGQISLIKIIWFHPDCKKSLHQFLNRLRVIIDPFQQDSLTAMGDARIGQPAARSGRLFCYLPRVNKIDVDIQGMVSLEHPAKPLRDALRERTRHPRPDPDDIEMGYRSQALQYLLKLPVFQDQGVAAGEDHIPDLLMRPDVFNPLPDYLSRDRHLPDKPLPRAASAIDRTLMRHHEQGPVFIAMYHRGDRTVPFLIEGIINSNVIEEFLPVRNDLSVDGVTLFSDEGTEIRIEYHRISLE